MLSSAVKSGAGADAVLDGCKSVCSGDDASDYAYGYFLAGVVCSSLGLRFLLWARCRVLVLLLYSRLLYNRLV